jgi:histone-binding protein RBBP4
MDIEEGFSTINETYKIWKKHCPFLYSLLQSYELPSCSQTVEWFSDGYIENDWRVCSLLIGSNSLTQNALQVLSVGVPTDDSLTDFAAYREERPELPIGANGFVGTMGQQQVSVKLSIPQASEVMRARINRFDENFIAVKTGGANPEFIIYDLRNKEEELENHAFKLPGHTEEGFGLAWSPLDSQRLLSGSYDRRLLLFNMERLEAPEGSWECSDGVEDVKWSSFNRNLMASAHCDEKVNL